MGAFAVVFVYRGWVNVQLVVAMSVDDAKQIVSDAMVAQEITGATILSATPLPRGMYSAVEEKRQA